MEQAVRKYQSILLYTVFRCSCLAILGGCSLVPHVVSGELDSASPHSLLTTSSRAWYDAPRFMEHVGFLYDSAYVVEWFATRDRLDQVNLDELNASDGLLLQYLKDLHNIGTDAYSNLRMVALRKPDTMAFTVNYGAVCRAYERSSQLAPNVDDPILQTLAHDLRQKLRILALKIESLMWDIPAGRDQPALLIWMYDRDSDPDSSALNEN